MPDNRFGYDAVQYLTAMLTVNTTLTSLDLDCESIVVLVLFNQSH